jgi:lysophospholipase L1-like esterase
MIRRLLLVGLLAAVLSSACGSSNPSGPTPIVPNPDPTPPQPTPPTPTLGITRVLAFGDSITAGTTSPTYTALALTAGRTESYPFKLQTLISARYTAQTISVFNSGNPGESVNDGYKRLGGVLSEATPQLLILMEGANDLNVLAILQSTNVSPIVATLEDMVRHALGRGITVMVATLPPQRVGGKGNPAVVPKFNNEVKAMAAKKGAILVDVNALLPLSLIGQDGLHPTEEGYQRLAEIFFDVIKTRYEVTSSASTQAVAHPASDASSRSATRSPASARDRLVQ